MKFSRAALSVICIAITSGACATKNDVDRLSGEIASLSAAQDSLVALLGEIERTLLVEFEKEQSLVMASRGDLQRQLNDMEVQLVQIQELLGQSQIVLRSLRQQAGQRPLTADAVAAGQGDTEDGAGGDPGSAGAVIPASVGTRRTDAPAVLYGAAIEQFRRGAYTTARSGFEEFLVAYPADELAPDAQFYVAETYREGGDTERALRGYSRVVELYPNSAAAPTALYKAGLLQVEQGNKDFACEYFQRVLAGYPRSDEARLAREQAQGLSCR